MRVRTRAVAVLGGLSLVAGAWPLLAAPAAGAATPATLYASTTGTDSATCGAQASPCKTIGRAVANASAGDTVIAEAGTYAESVVVTKQLTLTGQSATIDATGKDNGILLQGAGAAGTAVSGFTVENATGEGILAMQTTNVTISGNVVQNNDKGYNTKSSYMECQAQGEVPGDCGEGLHLMSVTNSTVTKNTVQGNSGGILVSDEMGPSSGNVISSNTVENNKYDCGITLPSHSTTALAANGTPQPTQGGVFDNQVIDNTVTGNGVSGGGGGGVLIAVAAPGGASYDNTIKGNNISGNGHVGVTIHSHAPNQDVNGNIIENNVIGTNNALGDFSAGDTATTGILVYSAVVPVTGITIEGNQISNNHYGIWLSHNVTATVSGNTYTGVTLDQLTTSSRLAGADGIGTSVAVSQDEFPTAGSAKAVVLARADLYPDALSGVPLAAKVGGPLLLTSSDSLSPATLTEIQRVLPKGDTVYLLGGTMALSTSVETAVTNAGYTPKRIAGTDRYATAVAVAGALGDPTTIFETTGAFFPDALSAGPAAIAKGAAILLTDGSKQDATTAAYLAAHPSDTRYAIGGPACTADLSATCVMGQDRYGTSAAVAAKFFPSAKAVGVATGVNFRDGLSAGPDMASHGGPILLVPPMGTLPSTIAKQLAAYQPGGPTVYVFGGPLAISDQVVAAVDMQAIG